MRLPEPNSIPALRAIASWPANVSRQPGRATLAGRPVRVDGDVAELGTEAVRAPEELTVEEDAAADADLAEDADEVLEVACGALPVLRERGQVRLVVGADGEPGEPGGDLVGDRDLGPAEVRRPQERARLSLDEARERDCHAGRDEILLGRPPRVPVPPSAPAGQHGARRERRLSVWTRRS